MPVGIRPRGGPQKPGTQQPREAPPQPPMHAPTPPLEMIGSDGVGPLMIASLPSMASGSDVYLRQFYRAPRLPFRRYLPVRSQ